MRPPNIPEALRALNDARREVTNSWSDPAARADHVVEALAFIQIAEDSLNGWTIEGEPEEATVTPC